MEQEQKQKKNRKGIYIVAAIAAVIVIGIVGCVIYQKLSMDPLSYYRMVEEKYRDEKVEGIHLYADMLEQSLGTSGSSQEMDMKITLSDTAKMMLGLTGVNLDELESLSIQGTTSVDKEKQTIQLQLATNEQSVLSVNEYIDLKDNAVYMQIPELSEAYLKMDSQDMEVNSLYNYQEFSSKCVKCTNNVAKLYERYTDILLDDIKSVDKTETTIEASGVSMDVDCYAVEQKGKAAYQTIEKILDRLKKDEDFLEITEIAGETEQENILKEVDNLKKEIQETEDETLSVKCQTYISDKTIYGRKLIVVTEEDKLEFEYLVPQDGNDFGMILSAKDKEKEYVAVEGEGTIAKETLNGEFRISTSEEVAKEMSEDIADNKNLLTIKVKDYDLTAFEKGKHSGIVTLSTGAIANLTNYAMRMEMKGDVKEANHKISILGGADELVVMEVQTKQINAAEMIKPKEPIYQITDEQAMLKYQTEVGMNLPNLLSDLKEKSGVDLSQYFLGMMQGQGLYD